MFLPAFLSLKLGKDARKEIMFKAERQKPNNAKCLNGPLKLAYKSVYLFITA